MKSLNDVELLSLLLEDMPHAEECATALLQAYKMSFAKLLGEPIARLRMVEGIGVRRAQRMAIAAEIGRRAAQQQPASLDAISSSADIIEYFRPQLSALSHEECWVLYLTSANSIIESQRHSIGGIGATVVDCRLIIKRALELLATQIIMVHNHPSGTAQPSSGDISLTQRVRAASELFNIRLLDHIIISRTEEYSFLGAGLLV